MTKQRQRTTGSVSKQRQQEVKAQQNQQTDPGWLDRILGHPTTRAEREEAVNRLLIRGTIGTGIVIALLIGIALLWDQVIVPGQAVASVNGEAVTVAEFRERVNFERARLVQQLEGVIVQAEAFGMDPQQFLQQEPYSTWLNEVNFPDALGQRVLDDIVEDKLIAQEAAARGITVEENTVDEARNEFFGFDPTAVALIGVDPTVTPTPTITPTPFVSPTPSPTPLPTNTPTPTVEAEATAEITAEATDEPTPFPTIPPTNTPLPEERREQEIEQYEENQDAFADFIQTQGGVGASAITAFFERQALREAVKAAVVEEPETQLYVNVRHILVDTEGEALEIIDALQAGESFSELARANSTDTGSGARGGELDWAPVTNYVPEFAEAARTLPIGEISEPVQSQFGYHIMQVRGREEREASEAELEQLQDREFAAWLEEQRETNADSIEIYDNWPDFVPTS